MSMPLCHRRGKVQTAGKPLPRFCSCPLEGEPQRPPC